MPLRVSWGTKNAARVGPLTDQVAALNATAAGNAGSHQPPPLLLLAEC
jgi:hypothetical protein